MRPRVLPSDRVRYAATVAGLLAVYGAILVIDWLSRAVGREPTMPEGRYPWER